MTPLSDQVLPPGDRPERQPLGGVDLAFHKLEASEANHALYMFRTLLDRKARGDTYSERELREWAARVLDRVTLATRPWVDAA